MLPNNKGEGMLSDTETEHLLQLDIKEEPRLSPKSQWRISFTRKTQKTAKITQGLQQKSNFELSKDDKISQK